VKCVLVQTAASSPKKRSASLNRSHQEARAATRRRTRHDTISRRAPLRTRVERGGARLAPRAALSRARQRATGPGLLGQSCALLRRCCCFLRAPAACRSTHLVLPRASSCCFARAPRRLRSSRSEPRQRPLERCSAWRAAAAAGRRRWRTCALTAAAWTTTARGVSRWRSQTASWRRRENGPILAHQTRPSRVRALTWQL
jgi:hypothetical protein